MELIHHKVERLEAEIERLRAALRRIATQQVLEQVDVIECAQEALGVNEQSLTAAAEAEADNHHVLEVRSITRRELVRQIADEREACARVAERWSRGEDAAAAIRARGAGQKAVLLAHGDIGRAE